MFEFCYIKINSKPIKYLVLFIGMLSSYSCTKTSYQPYNLKEFDHISKTRKILTYTIDTRSKEDYELGHLQHAHNIPFSENFMNDLTAFFKTNSAPKSFLLFFYADNKEITSNQLNEIKQELKYYKHYKFISVNYLNEDFRYPID